MTDLVTGDAGISPFSAAAVNICCMHILTCPTVPFESRPVYVRTNDHIDAHFATCFLALVLIRLLENKLEHAFPLPRILDSLKKNNCTHMDSNNWQFTYYDEIIEACGKAFEKDLDYKYLTQQEIQRLLHY